MNEAQARLLVAERALSLGRGGVSSMARLTGMSRPTIVKGAAELEGSSPPAALAVGRLRARGGGRKPLEQVHPKLKGALDRLLRETTAGDPMSALRWTCKSTRTLAGEVSRRVGSVSHATLARCLHDMGYSLQVNQKVLEAESHPDRDAQFRYINARVKSFMRTGDPVLSVDTKKKEKVGRFRNAGARWMKRGEPEKVLTDDYPHLGLGKAIPYGAYDVALDRAVVNVGVSRETGEFAVESIRRWWRLMGQRYYGKAGRLLVCADGGGGNGSRLRSWKVHLQALASELGMPITVCHYPPGTSKWNKIEHRLFSFVSMNWKGKPLVSYETVVNLIGSTTTRSGLQVKAVLDTKRYDKQQFTKEDVDDLRIQRHRFHPDWNYTLSPTKT